MGGHIWQSFKRTSGDKSLVDVEEKYAVSFFLDSYTALKSCGKVSVVGSGGLGMKHRVPVRTKSER